MQSNRKSVLLLMALLSVAVLGTGCSGINSSHGVSPATFLLPGFFGQTSEPQEILAAESIQTCAPSN